MTATLLPNSGVTIDSGDHFWVENHHESETLKFQWARVQYNIAPGKKKLVPFEVVCLYFGDPRSMVGVIQSYKDSTGSGKVPERYAEVQRMCVRYGVYEQGMEDIAASVEAMNMKLERDGFKPLRWENFAARITTIEGDHLIPPLFDHDGTSSNVQFNLDEENSQDLATIIQSMQRKIKELENKDTVMQDRGITDNNDDGIEIDNPTGP